MKRGFSMYGLLCAVVASMMAPSGAFLELTKWERRRLEDQIRMGPTEVGALVIDEKKQA